MFFHVFSANEFWAIYRDTNWQQSSNYPDKKSIPLFLNILPKHSAIFKMNSMNGKYEKYFLRN